MESLSALGELRRASGITDFDHFEAALRRAAVRADPVFRNVLPAGTGSEAVVGQAERFATPMRRETTLF
jgi:hypothetical protein